MFLHVNKKVSVFNVIFSLFIGFKPFEFLWNFHSNFKFSTCHYAASCWSTFCLHNWRFVFSQILNKIAMGTVHVTVIQLMLLFPLKHEPVPLHGLKGIMLLQGQSSCGVLILDICHLSHSASQKSSGICLFPYTCQFRSIALSYSNPSFSVLEVSLFSILRLCSINFM